MFDHTKQSYLSLKKPVSFLHFCNILLGLKYCVIIVHVHKFKILPQDFFGSLKSFLTAFDLIPNTSTASLMSKAEHFFLMAYKKAVLKTIFEFKNLLKAWWITIFCCCALWILFYLFYCFLLALKHVSKFTTWLFLKRIYNSQNWLISISFSPISENIILIF